MGEASDWARMAVTFYLFLLGVWLVLAGISVWTLHHFTGPWGICLTVVGHGGCL